MSLIIGSAKKKPYLGSTEIAEVWLGNIKIYPDEIIIKYYEELLSSGYYHDLIKVPYQNIILFGSRTGVKYLNTNNMTFYNTNVTSGAWSRFVEAVDGNIYSIGYQSGSQSGLMKWSGVTGTSITLPATASFHNYINAVDGNTYLLSSASGIQKITSDSNILLTNITAGQYNFGFNSTLYSKTFFIGNTTGIKVLNEETGDIDNTNITSGKGCNNFIEFENKLFVFTDSGVRVWNDSTLQFDTVTATSAVYISPVITADNELYCGSTYGIKKYNKATNLFINTNLTTGTFRYSFTAINGVTYFASTITNAALYYLDSSTGNIVTTGITSSSQAITYIGDVGDYSYISGLNCWYRIYKDDNAIDWIKTVDFNGNTPLRIEEIDGKFYVTSYLYEKFNNYENISNYAGVGLVF